MRSRPTYLVGRAMVSLVLKCHSARGFCDFGCMRLLLFTGAIMNNPRPASLLAGLGSDNEIP
jgi:hypothetical protein